MVILSQHSSHDLMMLVNGYWPIVIKDLFTESKKLVLFLSYVNLNIPKNTIFGPTFRFHSN